MISVLGISRNRTQSISNSRCRERHSASRCSNSPNCRWRRRARTPRGVPNAVAPTTRVISANEGNKIQIAIVFKVSSDTSRRTLSRGRTSSEDQEHATVLADFSYVIKSFISGQLLYHVVG